jgi:hypothetical protein
MHVRNSVTLQRLLTDCGLTHEEAAVALEIDLATLQGYCEGEQPVPKVLWLALERLRDLRQNSD